jgi:hypothetical protein
LDQGQRRDLNLILIGTFIGIAVTMAIEGVKLTLELLGPAAAMTGRWALAAARRRMRPNSFG